LNSIFICIWQSISAFKPNNNLIIKVLRKILFLFFLFLSLTLREVKAQSNAYADLENWNPGFLVTKEEDTIYGPISINYQNDLVQVNEENTVKTFGANQILMVYIKENDSDNDRYLYSFPFHPYSDFKPHKFFEMLFSGKTICLLSREMVVTESVPMTDNFTLRTYYLTRRRLNTDFFILFPDQKVRGFSGSKKELLNLLSDEKEAIKKLIKAENLSVSKKEDLIKIITRYNQLKNTK